MTDVFRPIAAATPLVHIHRARDRRRLDAMLSEDRAYAAYALSHLEPGPFERTEFWVAEAPSGTGIVLRSDVIGETLITAGNPAAVGAILALHPGPRTAYLSTAAPEHMPAIARWFHIEEPLAMRRMSVTRAAFAPAVLRRPTETRRLHAADARAVNALYAVDDRAAQYNGRQLESAIYVGAFERGRLVAIAGTHVVSPMTSLGVVGNVLTHPNYRGQGLAELVTSQVTSTLFTMGCSLVVLTVDPLNTPAVRAYARLGYEPGAPIVEARLRRRDQLGIGAWLRRRRAEHIQGSEAVHVAPEDAGSSR